MENDISVVGISSVGIRDAGIFRSVIVVSGTVKLEVALGSP